MEIMSESEIVRPKDLEKLAAVMRASGKSESEIEEAVDKVKALAVAGGTYVEDES